MIFYFSCTGNTKWAAEYLSERTGDRLIDLTSHDADITFHVSTGESIGFCFPIHGWRPPLYVRQFVNRLHIKTSNGYKPYCYAICTAGDNIGEGMNMFMYDFAKTGLTINYAASLIMPESYVGLPFMDVDKKEKEMEKKEQARKDLYKAADDIMAHTDGMGKLHIGNWPRTNTRFLGNIFLKHIISDKHFTVDEDKCLRCGRCIKSCPVANMAADNNGLPQWLHNGNCLSCFACYHHCPTHAIEYGMRTKGKGQYYYTRNEGNAKRSDVRNGQVQAKRMP